MANGTQEVKEISAILKGPCFGFVGKEGKDNKVTVIRKLTNKEYTDLRKGIDCIMRFSEDIQLFSIVQLNYADYLRLLERHLKEYTENQSLSWYQIEQILITSNRGIVNYLLSMRMFLDHTETKLKHLYGDGSDKVKRFEAACSIEYDGCSSYRFLYRLRNYVQHCGMPVGEVTIKSTLSEQDPKKISNSLSIYVSKEGLLKYDSWGPVINDIKSLPPKIEIKPHIDETMKCLERINAVIVTDKFPELIPSAMAVKRLATSAKASGFPCVIKFKKDLEDSKQQTATFEWLPMHIVDKLLA